MRWAFWRDRSPEPRRPLPDDVGLPTASRPPAAPAARDQQERDDDPRPVPPAQRTSGAVPAADPPPQQSDAPLTAPDAPTDRRALAAAGSRLARLVAGDQDEPAPGEARTLAVAATAALAARLPALSGVDGAVTFDEPADELLHAYADLLATRSARRRADVDREDLLAVAHLAAAAAAVGAADEPALLLLAGVPGADQLRAAALLLAQTTEDGAAPGEHLAAEVGALFDTSR